MSDKSWPVLETYVGATGRQLPYQIWDGYGVEWNGTDFTCTLKISLGGVVVESALPMTALDETKGLYYVYYNFTDAGEYDSQITVTNGAGDKDLCDPVTIKVKEQI